MITGWMKDSFSSGSTNTKDVQIEYPLTSWSFNRDHTTEPPQNRDHVQYGSKAPNFMHSCQQKEVEIARLKLKLITVARL